MRMISYAQNFEDVMLARALHRVEHGFYIDVGANDPTVDSVTRAFYDRGWNGVNIEPVAQYYTALCQQRVHDINLAVAVGEQEGTLHFYNVADTGLSTADAALAEHYRQQGRQVDAQDVPLTTLDRICEQHARTPIHFLKIDVEGGETQVLRGFDLRRWQPWILVIEATRPLSEIPAEAEWEPIVLAAGYAPVYFDGINRYYLSPAQTALRCAFATPPNFFDGFLLRQDHFFTFPVAAQVAERAEVLAGERSAALLADARAKIESAEAVASAATAAVASTATAATASAAAVATMEDALGALKTQMSAMQGRHASELAGLREAASRAGQALAEREMQLERLRAWAKTADLRRNDSEMRCRDVQTESQQVQFDVAQAASEVSQLRAQLAEQHAQSEARIQTIYASTSWRVTMPMRLVSTGLRNCRLGLRQMVSQPRAASIKLLRRLALGLWGRARHSAVLANAMRGVLERHPRGGRSLLSRIRPPLATAPPSLDRDTPEDGPPASLPGARMRSAWDPSIVLSDQFRQLLERSLRERQALVHRVKELT